MSDFRFRIFNRKVRKEGAEFAEGSVISNSAFAFFLASSSLCVRFLKISDYSFSGENDPDRTGYEYSGNQYFPCKCFTANGPTNKYSNNRIDKCVSGDSCCTRNGQEPGISRERDNRAKQDQVR
jgi:hypothetical protein